MNNSKTSVSKLQYELFPPFAILAGDTFYFDNNTSVHASKLGYVHKADFLKEHGLHVPKSINYEARPELYGYAKLPPVEIPLPKVPDELKKYSFPNKLTIASNKEVGLLPVKPGEIISIFPTEDLDISVYQPPVASYLQTKFEGKELNGIMLYARFGTFGSRLAEMVSESQAGLQPRPLQLVFKPVEILENGYVKFLDKYINLAIRTKDLEKIQVLRP